jgi:hypothetical protein
MSRMLLTSTRSSVDLDYMRTESNHSYAGYAGYASIQFIILCYEIVQQRSQIMIYYCETNHWWPILRDAEAMDAWHMSQSNVFWVEALMMATLCSCV